MAGKGRRGRGGGGNGGGGGNRRGNRRPRWMRALEGAPKDNSGVVEVVTEQSAPVEEANSALAAAEQEVSSSSSTAKRPDGELGEVFDKQVKLNADVNLDLTKAQEADMKAFMANWEKNKSRYESVATKVDMPPELIAAIHWRESSGNFSTYLHQGDPLGKQAVNEPNDIPIFHDWEKAAIHALEQKRGIAEDVGLDSDTDKAEVLGTFAERYNGLGYHRYHNDVPSPYVYAGTDAYRAGKYVKDGKFSATAVDGQLGVLAMINELDALDIELTEVSPAEAYAKSMKNNVVLKEGTSGKDVEHLQQLLADLDYKVSVDGDFGSGTKSAVMEFQTDSKLKPVDGIVGRGTYSALDKAASKKT